ncbi:MAG: hypothetical protein ABL962_19990, partial [Fimbriimonadaceae bacterium]
EAGKDVKKMALGALKGASWDQIAYAGSGKYVVSTRAETTEGTAEIWLVDMNQSTKKRIANLPKSMLKEVACDQAGRIVLCGSIGSRYSAAEVVVCMDLNGKEIWRIGGTEGYGGGDAELLSPESVAFRKDGSVAVLNNVGGMVQIFDKNGKYQRRFDLEKAWKKDSIYPTKIVSKADGGFYIHDFSGDPSVWEMTAEGKPVRSFTPKLKGEDPRIRDMGLSGSNLWISDGENLFRLDSKGGIMQAIGEEPQPEILREASNMVVTWEGIIFANDRRTGTVHCFDATGKWLRAIKPPERQNLELVDGYRVSLGSQDRKDVIVDGSGRMTSRASERYDYIPTKRRPDGTWLRSSAYKGVAPDGSYVVVDDDLRNGGSGEYLCFYDANGKGKFMRRGPHGIGRLGEVAYDGNQVILNTDRGVFCVDRSGKPLWRAAMSNLYSVYLVKGVLYSLSRGNRILRYRI